MSTVLIDRVAAVVFQNNILRFDCVSSGPEGVERHSGTLLIPANQAGVILQTLVNATAELDKKIAEQVAAAAPAEAPAETAKKK
jgi:hypothetical protein